MARPIWKGVIRFGGVRVPVGLYSAAVDRSVSFRLLHATDLVPVKQHMVHPITGKIVPPDEIRRGYDLGDGRFVLLDDAELSSLEPPASRDIEVSRFVEAPGVARQWFDRPYYLAPDGDPVGYRALAAAMHQAGSEGVAHWVMRKKAYNGALRSDGERLMLLTLRAAREVIPASALPAPGGRKLDDKEIALARQLVDALEGDFDPNAFRDEYRERVLELVKAKAEGAPVRSPKARRRRAEVPLARALEDSVQRVRKERTPRAA